MKGVLNIIHFSVLERLLYPNWYYGMLFNRLYWQEYCIRRSLNLF